MPVVSIKDSAKIKKIYFIGIKGVGMTSLAILAKEAGFTVSGSDVDEEFLTDEILSENSIVYDSGFEAAALKRFTGEDAQATLVIATAAHLGLSNPQAIFAQENNISILTHGQAVGYFMAGKLFNRTFEGVSVLGCHGKTTVSAMIATFLAKVGFDPSYTVGTSQLFPLGNPGHFGKGNYFVAEADEFISDIQRDRTVKFLYQFPNYAIINNIDFDHPDVYKNLDEIIQVFQRFCERNIQKNGTLIANGDDANTSILLKTIKDKRRDIRIITYGENEANDVKIENFKEDGWGSTFDVMMRDKKLEHVRLQVPGLYNAKNALSGIALMMSLLCKEDQIISAVESFRGSKRRQELIGTTRNGAIVLDDYAHHPDEIKKTLLAVKRAYPEKKIIALFQPHTVERTGALEKEFADSFSDSSKTIFLPIFPSKREKDVSYDQMYVRIQQYMKNNNFDVEFLPDERKTHERDNSPFFLKKYRSNVVQYILTHLASKDAVIITLGAGDVYKIAYDLI